MHFRSNICYALYKYSTGDIQHDTQKLLDSGVFPHLREILFNITDEGDQNEDLNEKQKEYLNIEEKIFDASESSDFQEMDTALKNLEDFCENKMDWGEYQLEMLFRREIKKRDKNNSDNHGEEMAEVRRIY